MSGIKVSIIARTYNEEEHVRELLEGIYGQDFPDEEFEVIIVDSGSTDNTLSIVDDYPTRLVQIKPENFSFGYSLNKGIEAAKGKYVLMISGHCYPMNENWIKNMVKPFEKRDKVALVYGKQRGKETTKFSEEQIFQKWFPETKIHNQKHPFCNNANSAIRKSLWKEYKYDEELTGLEDIDWAKKMLKKGYQITYQPKAGIYHVHEETYKKIFRRYEREAISLRKMFPQMNFNLRSLIALASTNILTDLHYAYKEKFLIKKIIPIVLFRVSQFLGAYKGHRFDKKISTELKRKFYYPDKKEELKETEEDLNGKSNDSSEKEDKSKKYAEKLKKRIYYPKKVRRGSGLRYIKPIEFIQSIRRSIGE